MKGHARVPVQICVIKYTGRWIIHVDKFWRSYRKSDDMYSAVARKQIFFIHKSFVSCSPDRIYILG